MTFFPLVPSPTLSLFENPFLNLNSSLGWCQTYASCIFCKKGLKNIWKLHSDIIFPSWFFSVPLIILLVVVGFSTKLNALIYRVFIEIFSIQCFVLGLILWEWALRLVVHYPIVLSGVHYMMIQGFINIQLETKCKLQWYSLSMYFW